jgi:hypothetical protein
MKFQNDCIANGSSKEAACKVARCSTLLTAAVAAAAAAAKEGCVGTRNVVMNQQLYVY